MKKITIIVAGLLAAMPALAAAQTAPPAPAKGRVVVEHYYRIKWGSAGEFKRLYDLNHAPLLKEMMKSGQIVSIRTEEPFTHMSGGTRWDLRVTITYSNGDNAVVVGGGFDKAFDAAKARLYPDKKKLDAEEAARFALLEEHWDVIVIPVD